MKQVSPSTNDSIDPNDPELHMPPEPEELGAALTPEQLQEVEEAREINELVKAGKISF